MSLHLVTGYKGTAHITSADQGVLNAMSVGAGDYVFTKGKKFEYPIYLDLEDPSRASLGKNNLSAMCEVFLCTLQENGYYAGLYTNHTWLTTILDTARMVTLFDIWYARYPLSEKPTWNEEKYGKQLGMWQYTEEGTVPGIRGYVDINLMFQYE